jgi:integral membrane protein
MNAALTRYRVIAWIVGVLLLALTLVAMPMKYLADNGLGVQIIAPIHGWLYVVYLAAVIDLVRRLQWPVRYTLLVALAGTVPFLSFVMERKVVGWVRRPETSEVKELTTTN